MMCVSLMGPNAASTTGGKVLIRSLHRAIRDMPEEELRSSLTDIRNRLSDALDTPHTVTIPSDSPLVSLTTDSGPMVPLTVWDDASNDIAAIAEGD